MFIIASYGYSSKSRVPIKSARPQTLKRRYSLDVTTKGWKANAYDRTSKDAAEESSELFATLIPLTSDYEETDMRIARAPTSTLPSPLRFPELIKLDSPSFDDAIFLELEVSSLTNIDLWHVTTREMPWAWWADSILNVALEIISEKYNCESRSIWIANSLIASILYRVGKDGDVDGNNYKSYNQEKLRLAGKKWIFLPINDGFAEEDPLARGSHWSFLVIDIVDRSAIYEDGLFSHNDEWIGHAIAYYIMTGVGNLLNLELNFRVDHYAPHQWNNNLAPMWADNGPCGPWTIFSIILFTKRIIGFQDDGIEASRTISFDDVVWSWWEFDSKNVREYIQSIIFERRQRQVVEQANAAHSIALANLEEALNLPDESDQPMHRVAATTVRTLQAACSVTQNTSAATTTAVNGTQTAQEANGNDESAAEANIENYDSAMACVDHNHSTGDGVDENGEKSDEDLLLIDSRTVTPGISEGEEIVGDSLPTAEITEGTEWNPLALPPYISLFEVSAGETGPSAK